MSMNKKSVWKKSAVVTVAAVCALASSMTAFAHHQPHAFAQSAAEPDNKADETESLSYGMGVVNTDALKVRSAAEYDADAQALLKEGTVVDVVAEENGFYRILIKVEGYENPLDGYVRKEYLDLLTEDTADPIF